VIAAQLELQRPTLPGKVDGIVGWDPLELQCRGCGAVFTGERSRRAADIVLSGFHFHTCEGRDGKRRCPDCLAAAIAACPNAGRHQ
jgi:hypothetical protein